PGHALRLTRVMALDRLRNPRMYAPAPGKDPAHQRVVDAELASLFGDPVVGGGTAPGEALGVTRMGPRQDRPADVVERRGERDLVPVADAGHFRDVVSGTLDIEPVQAEAVRSQSESAVAIEDVVGGGRAEDRLDRSRPKPLDTIGHADDAATALQLPCGADD